MIVIIDDIKAVVLIVKMLSVLAAKDQVLNGTITKMEELN